MFGESRFGSHGELCCGGEGVDRLAVCGARGFQAARGVFGSGEFGQAGGQDAVMDGGEEFRRVQAVVGDLVAVRARDAGDQATVFEPAQVVGDLPGRHGAGVESRSSPVSARRSELAKPWGWQRNTSSADSRGVAAPVGQPQAGHAGAGGGGDRVGDGVQGVGAGDRVVAESLDVQQAPVGGKAELPQVGQAGQPFGDTEVVWGC